MQIYFESPRNEELQVTILDLMGKELSSATFIKSSPRFETTIDISDLPKAAYILRLKTADGALQELVLIKE